MKSSVLREPILVGREVELEQLQQHLNLAVEGKGATVFVSGEAGCGKTRLTKEFLDIAKTHGVTILSGWCLSNAAVPYFPFVEAFNSLDAYSDEENGAFNTQRLTMKTQLTGPINDSQQNELSNPQVWKDQAFATIIKELLHMSTIKPTILFIDDIHWADSASLALLHYVARSISSERILILVTYRTEEIVSNHKGQSHPLAETLRLMGREGLYEEIKLSNLNRRDVDKVAESMLGGELNSQFAEKIAQESRGNPLFVVELLRMVYGQGSLWQQNGQWHLAEDDLCIPDKVMDVIVRRVNLLKPNERRILDAASVLGEKFDPKLVASALSENSLNVLEALNSIAQSTLLVFNEDNFYRFKHAKIQEMLLNELSPLLSKEYHLRLADALESSIANAILPLSKIAYHYAQAGNNKKAVKYSLAAGKDALVRWSNLEAIKHFTFVLDISEDNKEREIALEGLGDAYYANCQFEDAIKVFDKLAQSEMPIIKLRALRKEMDAIWFQDRAPSQLVDLIKKAGLLAGVDRIENARVRWNIGRTNVWIGPEKLKQGFIDHEEALRVLEEEYSLADVAGLLWPVGLCRIWIGLEEDEGLAEMLRGIALLDELGDIHGEMISYQFGAVDWFCLCGLYEEGYGFLKKVKELSEKAGDFDSLAFAWLRLAEMPAGQGDFSQAITYCLKALDFCKKTDTKGTLCRIYARLTLLYALTGDLEKSKQYLVAQNPLPVEIREIPANFIHFLWAEAFFLASTGRIEQATQKLEQGNEILLKTFPKDGGLFWIKATYSLFLQLLGKKDEAMLQTDEVKRIVEAGEKKFEHVNVKAGLLAFIRPKVNEAFEIRLDIVNVSRSQGTIVKIENLLVPGLQIADFPSDYTLISGHVEPGQKAIAPFQVKVLRFRAKIPKAGTYTLDPKIEYIDELGESHSCKPRPVTLTAQRPEQAVQNVIEISVMGFASEPARKAFTYLVKAYNEDFYSRMIPKDQSGWRTLMQIVKEAPVTKHSMYGQMGKGGETVAELKRLRIVEAKFFVGERGRGGNILKLRALADKPKL